MHCDSKTKHSEEKNIKMFDFQVNNFFVFFLFGSKGFPVDRRYSNGNKNQILL